MVKKTRLTTLFFLIFLIIGFKNNTFESTNTYLICALNMI